MLLQQTREPPRVNLEKYDIKDSFVDIMHYTYNASLIIFYQFNIILLIPLWRKIYLIEKKDNNLIFSLFQYVIYSKNILYSKQLTPK